MMNTTATGIAEKTMAEQANDGMEAIRLRKIAEAKALLEVEGYKISTSPALWKDYSCVVTLRVQSHDFSEKKFKDIISSIVSSALPSLEKFQKLTTSHVVAISNIKFSEGKRVATKLVEDTRDGIG